MKQLSEHITTTKIPSWNSAACTLFEGNYHLGAAALINSLYRNGYRGIFYAGYRGEIPVWANGLDELEVAPDLSVKFVRILPGAHLSFCKALFLDQLLENIPSLKTVFYFDPDITLKSTWEMMLRWAENKVALCQDVNWNCPSTHPIRRDWDRYLNPHGFFPKHMQNSYHNAGFIGLGRSQRAFIETWEAIMEAVGPISGNRSTIAFGDLDFCFHKADQDSLNVTADIFPDAVSSMGPEAMDFCAGGHTMSHAVGSLKPWINGFIGNAFQGHSPSKADKEFFENTRGPIAVFSPAENFRRRIQLQMAAAISRFIRRN